jgi:uncharacterized membrane protein
VILRSFIRVSRRLESISAISSVVVTGDRVIVERQSAGVRTRREFNCYWTRLEVDGGAPMRASRLALRSEGQSIRFGDTLPVHERDSIARKLRQVLATR